MNTLFSRARTSIRITVVTAFILATVLTACLAIGLQYYFGQNMARKVAADHYTTASSGIAGELRSIGRLNANIIDLLAGNPTLRDTNNEAAHLDIFIQVLEQNPLYYGIYVGGGDGGFYEVINLDASDVARRILRALPSDRWLIVKVRQGEDGWERQYQYLDESQNIRMTRSEPTDYDVRSRPWYTSAMESDTVHTTDPYIFAQLGVPGRTVSKRVDGSESVVAIDMTLLTISELLREQQVAAQGDVYLFTDTGQIIATSVAEHSTLSAPPIPKLTLTEEEKQFVATSPVLRVSNETDWPPIDYTRSGRPEGYAIEIINLIGQMTGLKLSFTNGYNWPELVELYQRGEIDLLHPVVLTDANRNLGLYGDSFADLPFSVATREGSPLISDLSQLNTQSLAIPSGWSIIPIVRARYPLIKIIETDSTLQALEFVLSGDADAALDNDVIMHYIAHNHFLEHLQFNSNVSFGNNELPDKLHIIVAADKPQLRSLIDKAIAAIGEQQRNYLAQKWLTTDITPEATTSNVVPSEALLDIATNTALQGQIVETQLKGETFLAYATPLDGNEDSIFMGILAPLDTIVDPFLRQVKISIATTAAFLLILIPASWFFANPIVRPIKQLAIENDKVRRREYAKVTHVDTHIRELKELSGSMVNMVEAIQAHELAQRELMDSFIELIAQAIDDKSAYTGGHCKRVPELALMLAERASVSNLPAFRNFSLESDDQWREYRIAAWLHDCGKITTPEHIVDKGSKLETIYNRIHEVRMRYEVLWRDREIEYWKQLLETPEQASELLRQLKNEQQELVEEFTFVASCNVGGEFLDQDKLDRLQSIATKTWQRHFDDRLGLSPLEELRISASEQTLPKTEQLLSDKPEHIIERTQTTDYPPEFGIDMDIPEHLYNLGEVYNLSVSRGTLTEEDRFKINEHMISTIKMLESLPFPEELRNVPRYASTHHETMKGTGYPRKLPGTELSIPERILAVADVFEALTASDRPYKKAKTVSEAMDIMHKMVLDNHIDSDCFELFLRDRVYLRYAREFLPESQLDEFDASKYLVGYSV
jgi:HD-GYP domain-containing protein (c-di-GMP phosphodiesterase class II)/ABC-type amino acid transport substrate-binding protein